MCTLKASQSTISTGSRVLPVYPHREAAPWGCHHITVGWGNSLSGSLPWNRNGATGRCWGTIWKRRNLMPSNSKSVQGVGESLFIPGVIISVWANIHGSVLICLFLFVFLSSSWPRMVLCHLWKQIHSQSMTFLKMTWMWTTQRWTITFSSSLWLLEGAVLFSVPLVSVALMWKRSMNCVPCACPGRSVGVAAREYVILRPVLAAWPALSAR